MSRYRMQFAAFTCSLTARARTYNPSMAAPGAYARALATPASLPQHPLPTPLRPPRVVSHRYRDASGSSDRPHVASVPADARRAPVRKHRRDHGWCQ